MQSQQVAREGNALLKRDLEAQALRHKAAADRMRSDLETMTNRCSGLESDLR